MKWLINYSFGSHNMERGGLEDQHLPTWINLKRTLALQRVSYSSSWKTEKCGDD